MTVRITQTKGSAVDAKLFAAAAGMAGAVQRGLRDCVRLSVDHENNAIRVMTGGDMMLSNQRRRMSARGGVRNQRKAYGQAAVGPKGPVALIENGAQVHMIGIGGRATAKRARNLVSFDGVYGTYSKYRSKKYGGKLLLLSDRRGPSGGPVFARAPVRHPGMRGRGLWKQTRDSLIAPQASRRMRMVVARGTTGGFSRGR